MGPGRQQGQEVPAQGQADASEQKAAELKIFVDTTAASS
jgi:hypothetical protein